MSLDTSDCIKRNSLMHRDRESSSVKCTAVKIVPCQWYVTLVCFGLYRSIFLPPFCVDSFFAILLAELQELGQAVAEVKSGSGRRDGSLSVG
jgi:hypothetical protein